MSESKLRAKSGLAAGQDGKAPAVPDPGLGDKRTGRSYDVVRLIDETDELTNAILRKHEEATRVLSVSVEAIFVFYGRFSTEKQDVNSIFRQKKASLVYVGRLGVQAFLDDYVDEASSAARIKDRKDMQKLINDAVARKFTDVVVERYSRWCRNKFDGAWLAQFLDKLGIRLHIVTIGRVVPPAEQIQMAIDAENERKNIAGIMSAGMDLKIEMHGAAPTIPYGFKRSPEPCFPDHDEVEAPIVQEIFVLILAMSAEDVAQVLNGRGVATPSGEGLWDYASVLAIIHRVFYTGRIVHRRWRYGIDDEGNALPREINPLDRLAKGRNEKFRLVSDEAFTLAQQAVAARNHAKPAERRDPRIGIIGRLHCDCDVGHPQSFRRTGEEPQVRYTCSMGRSCARTPRSLDARTVDNALFNLLKRELGGSASEKEFALELDRERSRRLNATRKSIEDIRTELERRDVIAERALDNVLTKGFDISRIETHAARNTVAITDLKRRLGLAESRMQDLENGAPCLRQLGDELAAVVEEVPFIAMTQGEIEFAKACQAIFPSVQLVREGLPQGRAQIKVQMCLDVVGDAGSGDFHVVELVTPHRIKRAAAHAELQELAASGRYDLTDSQWSIVESRLALRIMRSLNVVDPRRAFDGALFLMRTGVTLRQLPALFGKVKAVERLIRRYGKSGDLAMMVRALTEHDPSWGEALDTRLRERFPSPEVRPEDEETLAARRRRSRELTDAEWQASKACLHPRVERPQSRKGVTIDGRALLNGILNCLSESVPWSRMSAAYGDPKALRAAVLRLNYTSSWERLLKLWNHDYPHITRGLPIERMLSRPTLSDMKRKRMAEARAWRASNGKPATRQRKSA